MRVIDGAGRFTQPGEGEGTHWVEQLRATDLSVGTYSIPAGGVDNQEPHSEDEIYLVTAGQATFEAGEGKSVERRVRVGPGSVLYVPAGQAHRFTRVTADLAAVVVFAPAEGSREPSASRLGVA
jgi:mannose-6-phosphate isomerase-like protein (cupin superfamily)